MSLEGYYSRLPRRVVRHTIVTFSYTSHISNEILELGAELCMLAPELQVLKVVRWGSCRACADIAVSRGIASFFRHIVVTNVTVR